MNSLILCLAILVPVISGAISLGDSDTFVDDVRAAVAATPCCMPKGTSCVISNYLNCCSKAYVKTTCYQCGKTATAIPAAQCSLSSLVPTTKPACCIPDGFSCNSTSTCKNCCSGAVVSQTCLQCA